MNESVRKEAIDFLENQKQFHLGFLPTEQSNPLTRNLDGEFAASTVRGVKNLQSVDRNVLKKGWGFAVYLATWIPVGIMGILKKDDKEWFHTPHQSKHNNYLFLNQLLYH